MPDDGLVLTRAAWLMADAAAEATAPPPPVDFSAWARRNVQFGKESKFPGPYRPERFPFFAPILEALSPEDPCPVVVLKKSAQVGGTVLAQIFVGGSLDLDPGPVLYVHPTENNAVRWSKQKWKAFLKGTSTLRQNFRDTTSRDGGNSILYQERIDGRGFLQISGANSEASLSMVSMPRQVQDDLSKWEMNAAGDPEDQADTRSKAFGRKRKVFKIGTPLIVPGCRITAAYARGTRERLFGPCPHCAEPFELTWENFRDNIDPDRLDAAGFTCPACGGVMEERHRRDWMRRAAFRAENPTADWRSFYVWAAHSLLESWRSIAERWIAAKGNPDREKTVLNDDAGIAYEAAGEAPSWERLRDRPAHLRHPMGIVPAGANGILVIGCDVQGDRIEWAAWAFTRGLRRYLLQTGVVEGTIDKPATQRALDAMLAKTWPTATGRRQAADMLAIDANYETDLVLEWVKRHPASRVIAVRGAKSEQAPFLAEVKYERRRDGKVKRRGRSRFFNVGVAAMKMGLYRCLARLDQAEVGFVGFPEGIDDEVYRQITAEKRVRRQVSRRGFAYRWEKEPSQANEQLDMANYAEAGAIRLGWRQKTEDEWDNHLAEREAPPEAAQLDLEDYRPGATPPARRAGGLAIADQLA